MNARPDPDDSSDNPVRTQKEKEAERTARVEQKTAADHALGKATEQQNTAAREAAEKAAREAERERQERQERQHREAQPSGGKGGGGGKTGGGGEKGGSGAKDHIGGGQFK